MADEYKSIYSGQEVDNAVATAQKALTTDNLVQTTGPSPNNIMSQAATTAAIQNIKAGTTVIVNNVAQTTWNADTKVDVAQGTNNVGKAMIVGADGNLSPQSIPASGTTVTVGGQAQSTWDADTKINVFQGTENAGKTFMVGQDGNAVLQTVSSSQGITQLVGTQENPINLHTDTEIGQLYSVSGYIIKSSNVTMSNIPVSLFYRSSDGGGVIYGIHIDSSSYGTTSRCNGTIITFNISTGYMTNFIKFISLSRLNGSTPSSLLSIYAPTSSGESGQVLQSNGQNNAPTWIDAPNGIKTLVGTEENPINLGELNLGQLYFIKGWYSTYGRVATKFPTDSRYYLCYAFNVDNNNRKSITIYGYFMATPFYIGTDSISYNSGTTVITGPGYGDNVIYFSGLDRINGNTHTPNQSIYAPTTSGTSGQILQSNGEKTAPTWIDMPSIAPTLEEQTIESASWTSLSGQTPYTYSATITLTTALDLNSIVELINNQPTLFATYGFAIGSISGQVATIYSIGQPSTSVTLTVGVTG